MKSLDTIQKIAKAGKILSTIAFVCSLVGFFGCVAGAVAIGLGGEAFAIGEKITIHGIIANSTGYSNAALQGIMIMGLVECAAEAVVAKFAELYFKHELAAGTPFTHKGTDELRNLGILVIAVSVGSELVLSVLAELVTFWNQSLAELHLDLGGSVGLGIGMLLFSAICRYGADMAAKQSE